jgi:signal transduction histidine kinase
MLEELKNLKQNVLRPVVNEGLQFWREKIYRSLSLTFVIFGFLAYVPSVYLAVHLQIWSVTVLDTIVYFLVVSLFLFRQLPYNIRVAGLLIVIYILGLALLLFLGSSGAGLIWLFSFPVWGSILKGYRCSIICIIINIITVIGLGILLKYDLFLKEMMFSYQLDSWTIIAINFICLNGLVSMPISALLDGLETTIEKERIAQEQLKNEQDTLQSRNADLKRINADLDNFVYIASHDLKAPINNIEGLIEVLEMELEQRGDVSNIIQLIRKSTERFKQTILSLTEVTKAQQNEGEDRDENLDINEVFNEVIFSLNDLIEKYSPLVHTSFNLSQINYSRKDLTSILYNLISNAIKYRSPKRPSLVTVSSGLSSDNYFFISVKDNGLGMHGDYQEKIFRMFKRMHDHVEGSGVGLYIIKRIAENHGGRVEVFSEFDKGSVFTVYLKKKTNVL